MKQVAKEFLRFAIRIGALEFVPEGRKLKSGRFSPYFFNSGRFRTGRAMEKLADAYASAIKACFEDDFTTHEPRLDFDVLYGPPYKGTLMVGSIAASLSRHFGYDVGFCSSRKEAKGHGEGGLLIGAEISVGTQVLIVDDVITDGGTKREAVEFIWSFDGIPAGLLIAFDRQERGQSGALSAAQAFDAEFGIPVHSVATLSDLIELIEAGDVPLTNTEIETMLPLLLAYREEYGVAVR